MCIPRARQVSNSFVKLFNFSCLLSSSHCEEKCVFLDCGAVHAGSRVQKAKIMPPSVRQREMWLSFTYWWRWRGTLIFKAEKCKRKRRRCIVPLFSALWGNLRLLHNILSDSMVWGRPEARWTHGTLNQAVGKKPTWLWHFFLRKNPHPTCKISIYLPVTLLQYLHLPYSFSRYISTTESGLSPVLC